MNRGDLSYLVNGGDPRVVLDRFQEADETLTHKLSVETRYGFLNALSQRIDDSRAYYEWLLDVQVLNNLVEMARTREGGRLGFRTFLGETKYDLFVPSKFSDTC